MFKDILSTESYLKEMTIEDLNVRQNFRLNHDCNMASLAVVPTDFAASCPCPMAQANQLCCQPVMPDTATQVGLVSIEDAPKCYINVFHDGFSSAEKL